jgi:enoyl-CoA hydratase/carnithine racemase
MLVVSDPTILVERSGARVDIVLHRPERKNAVVQQMALELRDAIHTVGDDPTVACIVLSGAGGAFCSGMDLKAAGPDLKAEPVSAWVEVHTAIYRCKVPIVVALERFAINAGAALVLAANIVVAGESSFLQVSEMAMGVPAPMCQAWLHLRHSPAVADRVTLLTDRIPAAEARQLGLVTEVVPDGDVVGRARELGDRIAGYPASGRRGVAAVWRHLRGELDDPDAWFTWLAAGNRP